MTRRLFNLAANYASWLFWTVTYAFRRDPHTLEFWLRKVERTRKPWWKFRPCVYHNDDGNEWEIWMNDQRTFARRCCIPDCKVAIDEETGRVVGVTLFDEILADGRTLPDWFGTNRRQNMSA